MIERGVNGRILFFSYLCTTPKIFYLISHTFQSVPSSFSSNQFQPAVSILISYQTALFYLQNFLEAKLFENNSFIEMTHLWYKVRGKFKQLKWQLMKLRLFILFFHMYRLLLNYSKLDWLFVNYLRILYIKSVDRL